MLIRVTLLICVDTVYSGKFGMNIISIKYFTLLTTKKKSEKLSSYITTYGDKSVNLQELLLKLHILYLEEGPVLFILSINNFLESAEGSGCEQMTPKLENKTFSVKSTQFIGLKCHKEPYTSHFRLAIKVCSS